MSRRRCLAAFALAALPALVVPAAATAGTASTRTITFPDRSTGKPGPPVTVVGLRYQAGPQEPNRLHIEVDAEGATLTDRARIRVGRGCRRVRGSGRRTVRCNFRGLAGLDGEAGGEVRVRARLGARRDVAVLTGDFPRSLAQGTGSYVALEGGPGPDLLQSNAEFGMFIGGSGDDVMTGGPGVDIFSENRRRNGSDTMRGGSSPLFSDGDRVDYGQRRHGVVADLAGDRDDGARGERDRIGADIEGLLGGRGSDRLTGNAAANRVNGGGRGHDVIDGGAGLDRLSGGRTGVVRSRDGEHDQVRCAGRTRALVDGYDQASCAAERDGPVGLLAEVVPSDGYFGVTGTLSGTSPPGPPYTMQFAVVCPPGAPQRCAGGARLLGADGGTLGETTFDVPRADTDYDFDLVLMPVSEQGAERILAAGSEPATLLLDMAGVPQRRYAVTLAKL